MSEEFEKFKKAVKVIVNTPKEKKRKPKSNRRKHQRRKGARWLVRHVYRYLCTGCGAEKELDPRTKHYCDCNPGARFVFIVKSDKLLNEKIVKVMAPAVRARDGG